MRTPILLLVLACLAACSSLTPTDDPVYLRLTDVEARLMRIERVMENESLIAIAGEISSLRNDVQALRGEVETLAFEAESQATRQRDLYVDLDQRLAALEAAQGRAAAAPPAFGQPGGPGQVQLTDQEAYDAAYQLIGERQYQEAQAAFERFLVNHPSSELCDNAQYWLAEMHYVQGSYGTALPEFQRVIDDYPQSDKLPDALVKVGFSNYELRNFDAARQSLMQVIRLYPDTSAASSAEARLARIAAEAP
jgi:tol-pal system protein YbgF